MRMSIHAYRVVPRGGLTLHEVLEHIRHLPFEERLRNVHGSRLRLEAAERRQNTWSLDFGKIRREGPGRAAPNHPIVDFELHDEEGFGEETAAFFHGGTNFMALQYNHYGPKAAAIQAYLFRFASAIAGHGEEEELPGVDLGFTLLPVLRQNQMELLGQKGIVKTLSFTVSTQALREMHGRRRRSLSSVLDDPLTEGAQTIRARSS